MVSHERKDGSMEEYLFRIVKSVTITVKTFPFFYALGLILFWLVAPIFNYETLSFIDSLIFLSAVLVLFLIRLSYCVKLCIWRRLQCALPLLPQVIAQIDEHFYEFGEYVSAVNYATTGIVFTLSLVNAYFVFIKPSARLQRSGRSKWQRHYTAYIRYIL